MINYVFREIKGLSTNKQQVLEDTNLELYILESGVIYHAILNANLTLCKGTSLRMSKITYTIN